MNLDCIRVALTSDDMLHANSQDGAMCNKAPVDTYDPNDGDNTFNSSHPIRANPTRSHVQQANLIELQAKLAWIHMEVPERTLKVTTRLAKNYFRLPLRRHFKTRFPALNRNRLREVYATDTFFSSVPGISSGSTCMQLFVGKTSMFTMGYDMNTGESGGPVALEEFIADIGASYHIMSDNSTMQTDTVWRNILRKYNISFSTTEPHDSHQNYCERRIQDVKQGANRILDHTGASSTLWVYAIKYLWMF